MGKCASTVHKQTKPNRVSHNELYVKNQNIEKTVHEKENIYLPNEPAIEPNESVIEPM